MRCGPITQALVDEFGPGFNLTDAELYRIEDVILDVIRDQYETWDDAHDAACEIAQRFDGKTLPGTPVVWEV